MPQLSLYLNESAMDGLRASARKANRSLSRYVADLVTEKQQGRGWPAGYWEDVYGALADDSFVAPAELDAAHDGPLPQF
ncbi:antitoxin [Enterorhabdus sp. P55]|jgi:hypothetical protein|uniref:antitoxin n=1 Tax=Enterorhabdus sp. P55 TaxID=2304571 RepID=UPI00136EB2AB|nr:antitoxin [Enterorhabdus sp. P55]MCI8452159.1 antitoxin [Eggerthellaceae bacterium]NBI32736.1 antitoxin [Enterorhabdus sp. P55]